MYSFVYVTAMNNSCQNNVQDTPFQSVLVTFVTMISFAIGGPAISIFRLANDDTEVDSVPNPFLSYTIWIVFGIVVSVLFLNFLVCLILRF